MLGKLGNLRDFLEMVLPFLPFLVVFFRSISKPKRGPRLVFKFVTNFSDFSWK
jgi:hypothetical protein